MARAVTLGNGNLLVGLDYRGLVRDFYYPHVGHSNHVSGASGSYLHRVGVWVNGTLSWLTDSDWNITIDFKGCSGASSVVAVHERFGVRINFIDVVHNEKNVFLRKLTVTNTDDTPKEVKVYFGQEFRISESSRGDTAYYDPRVRSIIHYKGRIAFLAHAMLENASFTEYSIGLFGIEEKAGTYSDAEDGILSGNNIEHGSVDSVIGLTISLTGGESKTVYYWIAAGRCIPDTHALQQDIIEQGPEYFIESTINYWSAWKKKEKREIQDLPEVMQELYEHSLIVIRNHVDHDGGIIASSDSDILNQGRDTYSYLWPRDAGYTVEALDRAGYTDVVQKFFKFAATLLEEDGYFMHKYRVDGVLGSSWHPWVKDGVTRLPIQEDETAIVLYMLLQHYERARDLEFIESLYDPFIEKAADFLCSYIDTETGLPYDSYDLWEEKYGVSTYTSASVYGALIAAAEISGILGKRNNAQKYRHMAEEMKEAILSHLYMVESGAFVKQIVHENGVTTLDETIDISSLFGIVKFGVLPPFDVRVTKAVEVMFEKLWVSESGGYIRYVGDNYYRTRQNNPSNPWCIATLWVAQYFIRAAKTKADLEKPRKLIEWVCARASGTGMLPEQIHPHTLEHLSTSPLVWSHSELVITVDELAKKTIEFKKQERGM